MLRRTNNYDNYLLILPANLNYNKYNNNLVFIEVAYHFNLSL